MALLGREFIAVPDDRKSQIVFKWPDQNIRKYTRAIVNADELAMFVNTGQVVATMGPGRHQIDADELPGLGAVIDWATGGNAYKAELYFVGTREYTGNMFGGRIDDVQDPQTGMIVTLRVFGDYSMQVKDPAALITNLVGTVDVANNDAITGWMSDQLLKVMRTHMTLQIVRNGWPILGLSAYTPEIEEEVMAKGNQQLATYGVAIIRMGNFDINLSEQDEAQLKTLAKDTAYSRLAGSFQQYAAGEAALGAGEGMAKGGAGVSGAFLAAGLGVGGQAAAPVAPGPPPPSGPGFAGGGAGFAGPAATGVQCPSCHAGNAAGAKFCASCGTSLAPPAALCPSCHAENPAGAKFCSSCGTPMVVASPHCTSCGAEMAAGARFCPSCGAAAAAGTVAASGPPPEPPAPPAPSSP
jgi:membrane protease subunit (stomatin/prohibitin family)